MATAGAVVAAVAAAGGAYMNARSARKTARLKRRAAKKAAQYASDAAKLAADQLAEQHASDIELAEELMTFETETYSEATQYTTEQIAKRDAEVYAAAIAGYAASGISPYGEDSSAEAVLSRIEEGSLEEQERVMQGFETFTEARELELTQLETSSERTFEWFTEQSKFELAYELESRHAEAAMYRSQARYAGYGMYYGALSAGSQTYLSLQ